MVLTAGLYTPYRIIRKPRVLAGEPSALLSKGAAVDTSMSVPIVRTDNLDIIFNPDGSVIGPASPSGKIVLWVRDVTEDGLVDDQTLITIYVRSGLIAAHPADTSVSTKLIAQALANTNQIKVVGAANMLPGEPLLIDAGSTLEEIAIVKQASGNQVVLQSNLQNSHAAGAVVYVNPYSFTQDGRSSGM